MCHRYHYFGQNSPVALGVALGADRRKRHWSSAPQAPCQSQAPCQLELRARGRKRRADRKRRARGRKRRAPRRPAPCSAPAGAVLRAGRPGSRPQAPCSRPQAPCSRPQGGVSQPLARGGGVGTPFWRLNAQRERPPMLRLERQQNPKGRGPSAKGTHATYFSKTPGGYRERGPANC
jgi:hypothetical protein